MERILFLLDYGKLRLKVFVGIHKTSNPLDMKWQWSHWKNRRAALRKRR
jgi:hypothetical protein